MCVGLDNSNDVIGLDLLGYNISINRSVIKLCWLMLDNKYLCKLHLPKKEIALYKTTMNVLLTNLLRGKGLKYSRNRDNTAKVGKYNKRGIRNLTMVKCIALAEKQGYLENHIGYWSSDPDKRKPSYIVPSKKFNEIMFKDIFSKRKVNHETQKAFFQTENFIVLRDSDKKNIAYVSNKQTDTMNEDLREYNLMMHDVKVTDNTGKQLNTTAYRMFNEDFKHGGRLYKTDVLALKNKNNAYNRLKLQIDGEDVVEADYNNLHPVLLMIENGIKYDPTEDLYLKCIPKEYHQRTDIAKIRKNVKLAFNGLLNARNELAGIRSITSNLNHQANKEFRGSQIANWIKETHANLAHHFCNPKSKGLELQHVDSDIAMYVVNKFVALCKPILTVHDSFIVKRSDQQLLTQTMKEAIYTICGVKDLTISIDVEIFANEYHCRKELV